MTMQSVYKGIKGSGIDNDSEEIAQKYSKRCTIDTGYLAYRDLPDILNKYCQGNRALDYGCGAGYSTSLLKAWGFDVIGADISSHMIECANKNYPDIPFHHVKMGRLPYEDQSFDLVLSVFVLFDIPSMNMISRYAYEAKRVLKPDGIFIGVTGSEHFHKHNWLTAINDVENNQELKSGQTYSVRVLDVDVVFHDFYYSDADYIRSLEDGGLIKTASFHPLGKKEDNINWHTEWKLPPWVIYVCSSSAK